MRKRRGAPPGEIETGSDTVTPAAITLTVFLIALALFIADFLPMGLMVFMVPMTLYFCGVIEAKEIFAPLIGQSIILVVAMSVIGAALFKTGMAERIGRVLFRYCPGERSLMMAVTLFAGTVSSFVSNTGTVAILIPIIMGAAASHRVRPSRLLIPLTAGATLGGNISVIGSPGNLIAKETIERFSEGAMSVKFFEYAGVGIPLLLAAAIFYALAGPKLVPAKETARTAESDSKNMPGAGSKYNPPTGALFGGVTPGTENAWSPSTLSWEDYHLSETCIDATAMFVASCAVAVREEDRNRPPSKVDVEIRYVGYDSAIVNINQDIRGTAMILYSENETGPFASMAIDSVPGVKHTIHMKNLCRLSVNNEPVTLIFNLQFAVLHYLSNNVLRIWIKCFIEHNAIIDYQESQSASMPSISWP